ncbi:MAG: hypothetical protein DCC65_15955 [Planctomycetota bacterium]|nr:MAG: hypothetical protein DCC65_15955 [Planctomycetota bacterium]
MNRRRRIIFAAAAVVFGSIVALVFGDLIVYWWDARTAAGRPRAGPIPFTRLADPPINDMTPGGMRLRRMLDCTIVDPASGKEVRLRTNALGYRGGQVMPKAPGEYRILVLGDSITLSLHTEEKDTYPAVLERLLCDVAGTQQPTGSAGESSAPASAPAGPRGDSECLIRVINAGMRGAGLREELLILTETGLLTQPDLVIVGLYLNDAKRSRVYPLPEGLAAYSAIARKMSDIALANELSDKARARWEKYSGRPFPAMSFPLDAWRTDREAFEAEKAKAACDWGFAWFRAAWDEMRPDMQLIKDLAARYGFELVVVLFPSALQVEAEFLDDVPQAYFAEMVREMRIPHADLLIPMRAAFQATRRSLAYDNCHLTPEGNRLAAELIRELVHPFVAAHLEHARPADNANH